MTEVEELRLWFSIAFVLWVFVAGTTAPFYIRAIRRVGGKPFLAGTTALTLANMIEVSFFTYAIWFDLGATTTHVALLMIPGGLIFRALAYAIMGFGVYLAQQEHH